MKNTVNTEITIIPVDGGKTHVFKEAALKSFDIGDAYIFITGHVGVYCGKYEGYPAFYIACILPTEEVNVVLDDKTDNMRYYRILHEELQINYAKQVTARVLSAGVPVMPSAFNVITLGNPRVIYKYHAGYTAEYVSMWFNRHKSVLQEG
jgi:hypothetical protein